VLGDWADAILRETPAVLALGAHCDDIALGCGGFVKRLAQRNDLLVEVHAIVFSGGGDPVRAAEERTAAARLGIHELTIHDYPDTLLPNHWDAIKSDLLTERERLERNSGGVGIVFCPRTDDRHQDHRAVAENAWRAFRRHLILEYEIAKYEGDLGSPNVFVPLTSEEARAKAAILEDCYPSRKIHHWWATDVFLSLMRLRGVESNSDYAEAFTARKLVWR
jgi:LmbE family N-acetylglucosaminyl deacetylase